jgi:hypothetical protein
MQDRAIVAESRLGYLRRKTVPRTPQTNVGPMPCIPATLEVKLLTVVGKQTLTSATTQVRCPSCFLLTNSTLLTYGV